MVVLATAPTQYCAQVVGRSLEGMSRMAEEFNRQPPPRSDAQMQRRAEQLAEDIGPHLVPCCGGTLGNIFFTIFVLAPVIAGATMFGAQVAVGRAETRTLFVGFRRYWATVWVGTLCLIVGGGVAVVAGAVASVGARVGVMAASDATRQVVGLSAQVLFWALVCTLVVGMLWLSTRLWLALYRLVDPARPRLGARACIKWSWQRTAGVTQWQILGFMLLVGVVAGALMIPGEWLGASENATMRLAGLGVTVLLATLVWLPPTLAASGALYERLAPPPPPAAPSA